MVKVNHWRKSNIRVQEGSTRETGFTLIETVVALALVVGAIVGPLSLVSRSLSSAKTSKNRLVAAHLAQEGIEIIRHFRDNNILRDPQNVATWKGASPDDGDPSQGCVKKSGGLLEPGGINLADGSYEVDVGDCALAAYTGAIGHPNIYFDQSGGVYDNLFMRPGCKGEPSCTPTIFRRRITLTTFGAPGGCEGGGMAGETIPNSQCFQVTANVMWEEGGITKNIIISEILYNWR